MSFSEWREVKLGDLLNFRRGHDLPKTKMLVGNIPVVGSNGVIGFHNEFTTKAPCLTIGRSGNIGNPCYINKDSWAHNTSLYVDDFKGNDAKYLYYLLKTLNLGYYGGGSAVPTLNRNHIHPIEVMATLNKNEQQKIAATLSCIDNKIELNNRMNKTLEEIAQTIFKSWFVDFEPFQDGEFEDSELGMIPKGWRVGTLGEVIDLYDSMRKPLSSRVREQMKKKYPYYGATSLMDYVEDYIFDGIYVLLGEDGTVVDDEGYPILQYVWGKFWVNNHAHILKGKAGFNEDSIFMLLKNTNVHSIITGAVQLKINQANLKSIKIIIPDKTVIIEYNELIRHLFDKKRAIEEENHLLIGIRDALLPKLMSGEIRVPIEEVQ
jgi:type I restriction enzyme S subunit